MPKSKPSPEPWGELETELHQLTTLSRMLIHKDALQDSDEVMYFTSRLPEHVGRINQWFWQVYRVHLDEPPPPPPPPPKPLTRKEKLHIVNVFKRNIGLS